MPKLEYFCSRHGKLPDEDVVCTINGLVPVCLVCYVRREKDPRVQWYTEPVSMPGDLDGPGD